MRRRAAGVEAALTGIVQKFVALPLLVGKV